jgi:hypothetical protein
MRRYAANPVLAAMAARRAVDLYGTPDNVDGLRCAHIKASGTALTVEPTTLR